MRVADATARLESNAGRDATASGHAKVPVPKTSNGGDRVIDGSIETVDAEEKERIR